MKITFEYYTNHASSAAEAFTVAADCELETLALNKTTWGAMNYSISGEGDYESIAPLMEFFNTNGFSDENDFD